MKFNINSNHIRLYKLLKLYSLKDIDFLCEILKVKNKTITLYIKQLYHCIPNKANLTNSTKEMVVEIRESSDLLKTIKDFQIFTKDERALYIILKLLIRKKIILTELTKLFQVSRRTINEDLNCIKESLDIFDLNLTSDPGKGVLLSGDSINIKRALCIYIYKYLVESKELPLFFTTEYQKLIKKLNLESLTSECKDFLYNTNLDLFFYNSSLLESFTLSFIPLDKNHDLPTLRTIEDLNFFLQNFSKYFPNEDMNTLISLLKKTTLGSLKVSELKYFFNIIKICKGDFESDIYDLDFEIDNIISIFNKDFQINVACDDFLKSFVSRISFVKKQEHYIDIFEMFFLDLTLGEKTKKRCLKLFLLLRKNYSRISFSDVVSLYLWATTHEIQSEQKTAVLVYQNLPQNILPIMKDKIYVNHKLIILDYVTPNKLNSFLNKNSVHKVISFERIKVKSKIKITYFPILD